MPPVRLAVVHAVNERPNDSTHGLRKHLNRPRTTVDQTLQALQALNLVKVDEVEEARGASISTVWRWYLAEQVNTDALRLMGGTGNVGPSGYRDREESAKRPERTLPPTPPPTFPVLPAGPVTSHNRTGYSPTATASASSATGTQPRERDRTPRHPHRPA